MGWWFRPANENKKEGSSQRTGRAAADAAAVGGEFSDLLSKREGNERIAEGARHGAGV